MKQIVAVQNILSQVKKEHTVSGSDVSVRGINEVTIMTPLAN